MWYSCITTLAIWVYNEKDVVSTDISIPNTSISKIIDLINPVDELTKLHFQVAKMPNMNIVKHSKTSTLIKLSSLEMLIHDIKCVIRVLLI